MIYRWLIIFLIVNCQYTMGQVTSRLEILNVHTLERKLIYEARAHFEAPNWHQDGKTLIYNQDGRLYSIDIDNPSPRLINTGEQQQCNNDHGISPDGTQLVISNNDSDKSSRIYTLPMKGGTPKLITPDYPSYWHGWSPDGETLVYCASRNGAYNVFSIPVNGGQETQLTDTPTLDDGPEYSPDGEFIYFNSVRTGKMQIWRMRSNGSGQQQLTNDGYNDWFAHPSPNGEKVVFISYIDEIPPGDHPPFKQVMLRMMNPDGTEVQKLIELFGGQGTINVPSWSPDSQWIAFVSYEQ
ncbi:MAG: TolB family protein [Cyclobacteriaceae bacterium]